MSVARALVLATLSASAVVSSVLWSSAVLPLASAAPEEATPSETDRWVAWHRRRALLLRAEGRLEESVEEWTSISLLSGEVSASVRAAVEVIDAASTGKRYLQASDPFYVLAERMAYDAVRRAAIHDPSLAYVFGRMRLADQKWDQAFGPLDFARRRGFDPVRVDHWWFRAAVNYGRWLTENGREGEAIPILERALRDLPDHPQHFAARVNLAQAHRQNNEHTIAESILRDDILGVWPKCAKAWDLLGQVYGDQARVDEALDAHRRAMDLARESDDGTYTGPIVFAGALHHAADMELKKGDLDRALALAQQYARIKQDDCDGELLLGTVHQAMYDRSGATDEIEEAIRCYRRAARFNREDEPSRARLLSVLERMPGNEEELARVQKELDALRHGGMKK